jgi:hypothetical protein
MLAPSASLEWQCVTQLEVAATFSLSFQLTIDRLLFTVRRALASKIRCGGEGSGNRRTATGF